MFDNQSENSPQQIVQTILAEAGLGTPLTSDPYSLNKNGLKKLREGVVDARAAFEEVVGEKYKRLEPIVPMRRKSLWKVFNEACGGLSSTLYTLRDADLRREKISAGALTVSMDSVLRAIDGVIASDRPHL